MTIQPAPVDPGDFMADQIETPMMRTASFPPAPRGLWGNIPLVDWNNWRWQLKNQLTKLADLESLLDLTADEKSACVESLQQFRLGITPYYSSLMNKSDPDCPIRLQGVPRGAELEFHPGELEDPLAEDRDMPVTGLTHRYPDRVLLYTNHFCSVYCRHCTRRRKVSNPESALERDEFRDALDYIRQHGEIRDVVLSGGDPFSFSDKRLDSLLGQLKSIPHVELVRIGTRYPVTLPQRVTPELTDVLKRYHPLYVHTHFNHPRECTAESFEACRLLADAGCVLGNQMVLLRKVNDNPHVVRELNHRLLQMRVRPYYIYHCDAAMGVAHFRTSIAAGLEIMEHLQGWTSGMAVPHYVIDLPGGGGKITLTPNSIAAVTSTQVTFRNYAGDEFVVDDSDTEALVRLVDRNR